MTKAAPSIPGKVSILSHSSYIEHGKWTELGTGKVFEGDFLHIVGEVQNEGTIYVNRFDIGVTFFDSNGATLPIATRVYQSYSPILLAPGEKGPFLLILFDENTSKQTASYKLDPKFSTTTEQVYKLNILGHRNYINTLGNYKVVGEVENASGSDVVSVRIDAIFYDGTGKAIDMGLTYASLDTLVPGQKSSFQLWNHRDDIKDKIKSYSLRAECRAADRAVYQGFQIISDKSTSSKSYSVYSYTVEGQIKNTGNRDAKGVKVAATFYKADNTVAATGYTYANPIDLKIGDTGQFKITIYGDEAGVEISRYVLQFGCSQY